METLMLLADGFASALSLHNLAFGVWAGLSPGSYFDLFGMAPPRYPQVWQCLGLVLALYGLLYAHAARHLEAARPIILVGLLGKILGSNETQEQSLQLVFHYADQKGLPLLDLADLRSLLTFLASDDGKSELDGIGGLAKATVGVILRAMVGLETGGGSEFFGEPQLDVADLMRVSEDGRGQISCVELAAVQEHPELWSTALMWLVAQLFENTEKRDAAEVLPERLPEPIRYVSHRDFVRETLRREVTLSAAGTEFVDREQESEGTRTYRDHMNSQGSPSETVAAGYVWRPGTELTDPATRVGRAAEPTKGKKGKRRAA